MKLIKTKQFAEAALMGITKMEKTAINAHHHVQHASVIIHTMDAIHVRLAITWIRYTHIPRLMEDIVHYALRKIVIVLNVHPSALMMISTQINHVITLNAPNVMKAIHFQLISNHVSSAQKTVSLALIHKRVLNARKDTC